MTNERTNARPPARGNEPADGRARSDERASRLGGPVDRRPARLARTKLRFPLEIILPQHKREVSMTNERPPARGNEPADRRARSDEQASRRSGPADGQPARLARTKLRFPIEILLPQHKEEVSMTNERPPARGNEPAKRKNDLIFGNYFLET